MAHDNDAGGLKGGEDPVGVVPASGMSLYVHVPFCQTKCPYCDFNTYQGIESLFAPYLDALVTEVELWGRCLGRPLVNTVFFGGGTPSYLPEGSIARLMDAIRSSFAVASEPSPDGSPQAALETGTKMTPEIAEEITAEITIEANPGDLSAGLCHRLLSAGVNRISFGVQSLDDGLLQVLGRRHTAQQAVDAFTTARDAGFDNINLDLMYGLPGQTMTQWRDTAERLAGLAPSHISLYCLTLEDGTPMQSWVRQGRLPEPDPDLAADMYQYARELLAGAGYHHYEISNWAQPGRASTHNMAYWLNRPYLGVGPGAHSRLGSHRFWTVSSPRTYIANVERWARQQPCIIDRLDSAGGAAVLAGIPPIGGSEHISPDLSASETMFLGLRLLDGLDLADASASAGADLGARYESQIADLVDLRLLERDGSILRLTPDAYLIANQVFTRFLA